MKNSDTIRNQIHDLLACSKVPQPTVPPCAPLTGDVKVKVKVKVIPQQAKMAQGVPGGLRLQILLTLGTARVVGHQPYIPAALPQEKSLVLIFRG